MEMELELLEQAESREGRLKLEQSSSSKRNKVETSAAVLLKLVTPLLQLKHALHEVITDEAEVDSLASFLSQRGFAHRCRIDPLVVLPTDLMHSILVFSGMQYCFRYLLVSKAWNRQAMELATLVADHHRLELRFNLRHYLLISEFTTHPEILLTRTGAGEAMVWLTPRYTVPVEIDFELGFDAPLHDGLGRHGGIIVGAQEKLTRWIDQCGGIVFDWIDREADRGYRMYPCTANHGIRTIFNIRKPRLADLVFKWRIVVTQRGIWFYTVSEDNVQVLVSEYRGRRIHNGGGFVGFYSAPNTVLKVTKLRIRRLLSVES